MTKGKSYGWRDQLRATVRALGPEDTQPMPRIAREPPPIPPDLVELLRDARAVHRTGRIHLRK